MISAQFSGDSADGITSCPVRTAQEDVNSSSRPAFLSFAHCSTLETHQYPDPARGEHSLCHRFVWVRMSGDSTKEQPNYARPTTSSRTAALAERVSRSAQKPASAESRKQLQSKLKTKSGGYHQMLCGYSYATSVPSMHKTHQTQQSACALGRTEGQERKHLPWHQIRRCRPSVLKKRLGIVV